MSKAEKFDKFLEENKITCFSKEEVKTTCILWYTVRIWK